MLALNVPVGSKTLTLSQHTITLSRPRPHIAQTPSHYIQVYYVSSDKLFTFLFKKVYRYPKCIECFTTLHIKLLVFTMRLFSTVAPLQMIESQLK